MDFENRYHGIDQYAVRIIKYKAKKLVGLYGFAESDREDLEQEMILDLLRRLPKCDSERAKRNTFIAVIIQNKVATIIKARKAKKRGYGIHICSLDEDLAREGGSTRLRKEIINQEDYFHRTGELSRPATEIIDLSIDAERAVESLPPKLRSICKHLRILSITEISREIGIPRSTIYESIGKLRGLLEEAGLKDYL